MANNNYCNDVSAVLVTFNPNLDTLITGVKAVSGQVSNIYIVDNASLDFSISSFSNIELPTNVKLHILRQQENFGIGAGHNIGIKHAIEQGAKFVLLLDQDSQVEPDMVFKLRSAYILLIKKGYQVAAVGPQYRDSENGALSRFVQVGFLRFVPTSVADDGSTVEADFLVSSGSLIPISAIDVVGLMDESLFIDHVDTEWCFRAKSKGLKIFGLFGAVMMHTLGEQRKEFWFLRERTVPFHKSFRYYYMYRNSILLYYRSYMRWSWKFADMARCFKIAIFFSLAGDSRLAFLRMMCLGIVDGFKRVNGKRNEL